MYDSQTGRFFKLKVLNNFIIKVVHFYIKVHEIKIVFKIINCKIYLYYMLYLCPDQENNANY